MISNEIRDVMKEEIKIPHNTCHRDIEFFRCPVCGSTADLKVNWKDRVLFLFPKLYKLCACGDCGWDSRWGVR